ncbi:MAG: HAD-IIIA family hydrolase [Chloroflexota bacterium]|jgi:D-glycero-D-manno-heptose 1,7-bisphosphate phosphatase
MSGTVKWPAIFLDRDGVIIENRDDYVLSWSDVVIIPGAVEAIADLTAENNYQIVIVTNQSPIGQGLITKTDAERINYQLVRVIESAGGRIAGVFMCPHTDADDCDCRKPRPGLLLQAAADLQLDLSNSVMVGDALTDIKAARAAGVADARLVRTGRGQKQEKLPEAADLHPFAVYKNLGDAVACIRQ